MVAFVIDTITRAASESSSTCRARAFRYRESTTAGAQAVLSAIGTLQSNCIGRLDARKRPVRIHRPVGHHFRTHESNMQGRQTLIDQPTPDRPGSRNCGCSQE